MCRDGLTNRMRGASKNGADDHENVTKQNEGTSSEQITVGTTGHKGDCAANTVDRCDPGSLSSGRTQLNSHIGLNCAKEWDRQERNTIG